VRCQIQLFPSVLLDVKRAEDPICVKIVEERKESLHHDIESTTFYFRSGNCKNKFTELGRHKLKNLILFNNLNTFTDHLQESPILQIFYLEVFLSHSFMSFFSRFYSLIMMFRIQHMYL